MAATYSTIFIHNVIGLFIFREFCMDKLCLRKALLMQTYWHDVTCLICSEYDNEEAIHFAKTACNMKFQSFVVYEFYSLFTFIQSNFYFLTDYFLPVYVNSEPIHTDLWTVSSVFFSSGTHCWNCHGPDTQFGSTR